MRRNLRVSLTARLLVALIVPTAMLALVLGVGGALIINSIVESVNDRLLDASARSIADTLALEDGEVTLDLPPSAFGMLENDERDNVYYSVRVGKELLTGYPDLPQIKADPARTDDTVFAYSAYRDAPIRVAAIRCLAFMTTSGLEPVRPSLPGCSAQGIRNSCYRIAQSVVFI